jgi:hypothetical protein
MKNILFCPFGAADLCICTKEEKREPELSLISAVQ